MALLKICIQPYTHTIYVITIVIYGMVGMKFPLLYKICLNEISPVVINSATIWKKKHRFLKIKLYFVVLRYQTMLCILYNGAMVAIGKFHFSVECIFMQQRKRKTIYPHYIFMVKYHVDTQEYSI